MRPQEDTPEQNLWVAVLKMFLEDIQKTAARRTSRDRDHELREHLTLANSKWVHRICIYAGIDHGWLMGLVAKVIQRGKNHAQDFELL